MNVWFQQSSSNYVVGAFMINKILFTIADALFLSSFPGGVLFDDRLSAECLPNRAGQRRREIAAEVVGEV